MAEKHIKKTLKAKNELFSIKPKNIKQMGDFSLRGKSKAKNDYVAFFFKNKDEYKKVMDFLYINTKRVKKNYEGDVLLSIVEQLTGK